MKKFYAAAVAFALAASVGVVAAAPAGAAATRDVCKAVRLRDVHAGPVVVTAKQTTHFSLPVKGCKGSGGVKSGTSTRYDQGNEGRRPASRSRLPERRPRR